MRSKMSVNVTVKAAFIRMQPRLASNVFFHDFLDGLFISYRAMARTDTATTLNKSHNRTLITRAFAGVPIGTALALRRYARGLNFAVVGLIGLYDDAFATKRL